MTPEEFRKFGHQVVDWLADYRAGLANRPVMARTEPGQVTAELPTEPPQQGEDFAAILKDVDRLLIPGLSLWQHPHFYGYFPSNALLASVLGDFLSTGLGVLGLSWQSSPALTELEEVTLSWLRQMLGLSNAWKGVIQDTASTSTLLAMLCARERTTRFSGKEGGLGSERRPLKVYVSAHSHSSVEKAAVLAGFGKKNIRVVPHDDQYAMRADAFAALVGEDVASGALPCAVVATSGTTTTTAFDPIAEIAAAAHSRGIWLHVDAAMAGSAMILPECRELWDGIEEADSLVLNPHKWLGAAFDCSTYYVRDEAALVKVMSTSPSYLKSAGDEKVRNLRDWGIPLGRRFRALKLWCLIREQGVEGLQARLRRDMANARWLAEQIANRKSWQVLAPVALQTVCVRHEPAGLSGEALDRHTSAWVDRINRSGRAYLTPAQLDGRWMVRVSVGAEATQREHVAALWKWMQEAAEEA
jgi:aromatic-L-amino-acid decarboxylase